MAIDRTKIPEKIFYSISEVSKITSIKPHILRYWETKFSRLNPKRLSGNQRRYTRQDLELILTIDDLLKNEGYTLEGVEKQLRSGTVTPKEPNSINLLVPREEKNKVEEEKEPEIELKTETEAEPKEDYFNETAERFARELHTIRKDLLELLDIFK